MCAKAANPTQKILKSRKYRIQKRKTYGLAHGFIEQPHLYDENHLEVCVDTGRDGYKDPYLGYYKGKNPKNFEGMRRVN